MSAVSLVSSRPVAVPGCHSSRFKEYINLRSTSIVGLAGFANRVMFSWNSPPRACFTSGAARRTTDRFAAGKKSQLPGRQAAEPANLAERSPSGDAPPAD